MLKNKCIRRIRYYRSKQFGYLWVSFMLSFYCLVVTVLKMLPQQSVLVIGDYFMYLKIKKVYPFTQYIPYLQTFIGYDGMKWIWNGSSYKYLYYVDTRGFFYMDKQLSLFTQSFNGTHEDYSKKVYKNK